MNNDDVQELLDFQQSAQLTIDRLTERHQQEQDIEIQSEDRRTAANLTKVDGHCTLWEKWCGLERLQHLEGWEIG
ncbi:hypothetical protein TNCV_2007491 [Trichonephila clavipes]|nr:hypothetical protein TNCV_2007491 [Trichonephila clavipes]